MVSVRLSFAGVGGLSPATRTAVSATVAAATNTTAGDVDIDQVAVAMPLGRRLLQVPTTLELLVSLTSKSKVDSAASLTRLADSTALAASLSTAAGRAASVVRAARRDLAVTIAFTLPPASSAAAASASAAVASSMLAAAARAGTLLASNAALRASATAALAAPPTVDLGFGLLAPPSPPLPSPPPPPPRPPAPPSGYIPFMADNKFAAVLILSVVGLVLVIGVALKTCASPRRANAKIYRQSRKVLVAAEVSYAEEGAEEQPGPRKAAEEQGACSKATPRRRREADSPPCGPPVASREPWEHTPLPVRPAPPPPPRAAALLAAAPAGAEGEGAAQQRERRALLLSKLAEEAVQAGGSPEAPVSPGGIPRIASRPLLRLSSGSLTAELPAGVEPDSPAPRGSTWIANPLSMSRSADGLPRLSGAGGAGSGSSDDDSPLPQQLPASEWSRMSLGGSPLAAEPSDRFATPLQGTPASDEEDGRASGGAPRSAASQYDTPSRQPPLDDEA